MKKHEHIWHKFNPSKGSRQKRPDEKKWVLVMVEAGQQSLPRGVGVGYRKNGGDDKQSPFFVIPGLFPSGGKVIAWCDCLPDGWIWPYHLNKESDVQ